MSVDLDELSESLSAIAEMLETNCRVASDPLAVVDSMVEELRKWVEILDQQS